MTLKTLEWIHEHKTAALLEFCVVGGGILGGATPDEVKRLSKFAMNIGLAFQIIDDILDITQTSEQLGKTAGKDTKAQKATYPSIVGMEKSRKLAKDLTARAFASLKIFKGRAQALEALAHYLLLRDK